MRGSYRDERGAAALEFAILVPAFVILVAVVVGGARTWLARSTTEQIAGAAARGASLARSSAEARSVATRLGDEQARLSGLRCNPLNVDVDTSGFRIPPGQAATVTVSATCQVPLGDVLVPGWPGSVRVDARATSVLDRYRGRQ